MLGIHNIWYLGIPIIYDSHVLRNSIFLKQIKEAMNALVTQICKFKAKMPRRYVLFSYKSRKIWCVLTPKV